MLEKQLEHGMILIGVSGYSGAGKDAFANFFVEDFGYTRYSFGDVVKEALYALNPAIGFNKSTGKVTFLKPLVDAQNGTFTEKWDKVKRIEEVRRLLQRIGTEVGRQMFGADIWVDASFRKMERETAPPGTPFKFIVPDIRFPNEAEAICRMGGYMIRVHRPAVGPLRDSKGRTHLSEIALDNWKDFDYNIHNDGSLNELHEKVVQIVPMFAPKTKESA